MQSTLRTFHSIGIRTVVTACAVIIGCATPCDAAPSPSPADVRSFFNQLVGDWIGTVEQSTNQQAAETKYFHANVKQTAQDIYSGSFTYYRLDKRTQTPIQIGATTMINGVHPDGTSTNTIEGSGEVLVDPKTLKHEEHHLSEVLRILPSGGVEGKGTGTIDVSGIALGAGKNGKVSDYTSIWSLDNGILSITERLHVTFRVLFFAKHYDIVYSFKAHRGSDLAGLMKNAPANGVR